MLQPSLQYEQARCTHDVDSGKKTCGILAYSPHFWVLQAFDRLLRPRPCSLQVFPSPLGFGLLHCLRFHIKPPPQVTEQALQSLHFEYPPSVPKSWIQIVVNNQTARVARTNKEIKKRAECVVELYKHAGILRTPEKCFSHFSSVVKFLRAYITQQFTRKKFFISFIK